MSSDRAKAQLAAAVGWIALALSCTSPERIDPVSTGGGAGPTGGDGLLHLDFEPVSHPLALSLVTDMEFLPEPSDEFVVTDLLGGFAHLRLGADGAVVLTEAMIDDVFVDGAAGLVGLAIDPDFAENRHVYMAMALSKQKNIVRRYTLTAGDPQATLDSMVPILEIDTPGAPRWHNITSMGFDPDGVMWLLIGDKGMFDPAQDDQDLLGSLIRILPSKEAGVGGYTTPEDAPRFSEEADPAIFAKGVRSPWKGLLYEGKWYYGEVGLDEFEEINVISAPGQNFGWPLVEGPCALDIFESAPSDCAEVVDPWVYYDRSNSHPFVADDRDAVATNKRSVYVGWIYQPTADDPYKGLWNDVVTFGDTYVGFIRGKRVNEAGDDWHVGHLRWASAWDQGPDGYVYVMALADFPPEQLGPDQPSPLYRAVLGD